MEVRESQIPAFFSIIAFENTREKSISVDEAREKLTTPPKPDRTNPREILNESVRQVVKEMPTLEATGPLSLFRVADVIRFFSNRVNARQIPITDNLDQKPQFTDLKFSRLEDIKRSLKNLSETNTELLQEGVFNTRNAKSSRSALVAALAGEDSPVTLFSTFSVVPTRLAHENILVSDKLITPFPALGFSGSFFVNGFKIAVVSTDSIIDIKDKINFGEDVNKNGILDLGEDINENGVADILSIPNSESGVGVFITEDINGNGVLDGTEDANNNERLDGGTLENRVIASIQSNRLVLTSLAGGSTKIDLRDDNSILLELGFFELNFKGNPVQKELQFKGSLPEVNLIENPSQAEIEFEGEVLNSDFDIFVGALGQTALILQEASDKTAEISISIDPTDVVELIKNFFNQFNSSIGLINEVLTESLAFDKDPAIQELRKDLVSKIEKETAAINKRNAAIDKVRGRAENEQEIGVFLNCTEKNIVQETAVTSALQTAKSGMAFVFGISERDLGNRLTSIGIRGLEDDTFAINEPKLKRAFTVNAKEIVGLFNDPETGILPNLQKEQNRILKEDLGDLDLKRDEIQVQTGIPNSMEEQFRRLKDNADLRTKVQNLIAVI